MEQVSVPWTLWSSPSWFCNSCNGRWFKGYMIYDFSLKLHVLICCQNMYVQIKGIVHQWDAPESGLIGYAVFQLDLDLQLLQPAGPHFHQKVPSSSKDYFSKKKDDWKPLGRGEQGLRLLGNQTSHCRLRHTMSSLGSRFLLDAWCQCKKCNYASWFVDRDHVFHHLAPRGESLRPFSTMNGVGPGQNQKTCDQTMIFLQKSYISITAKLRVKYVKNYGFLWVYFGFFRVFYGYVFLYGSLRQ